MCHSSPSLHNKVYFRLGYNDKCHNRTLESPTNKLRAEIDPHQASQQGFPGEFLFCRSTKRRKHPESNTATIPEGFLNHRPVSVGHGCVSTLYFIFCRVTIADRGVIVSLLNAEMFVLLYENTVLLFIFREMP